ncbi:50S ribosomal protein L6 [Patescibacteria group bacterium]|nr:50S ribosomal protein L6 [Patescibacteria group bacterium]
MSKIGKQPITIPKNVEVLIDGQSVVIKGTKGELAYTLPELVNAGIEDSELRVNRVNDLPTAKALHGTWRAHLQNAVIGVDKGYEKILELVGLGYRAELKEGKLVLLVGFSHSVEVKIPEGIKASVVKNKISVEGIDKHQVGQIAAIIRRVRPPEPYKGTGIRYADEVIRLKPGKSARAVGAGT